MIPPRDGGAGRARGRRRAARGRGSWFPGLGGRCRPRRCARPSRSRPVGRPRWSPFSDLTESTEEAVSDCHLIISNYDRRRVFGIPPSVGNGDIPAPGVLQVNWRDGNDSLQPELKDPKESDLGVPQRRVEIFGHRDFEGVKIATETWGQRRQPSGKKLLLEQVTMSV